MTREIQEQWKMYDTRKDGNCYGMLVLYIYFLKWTKNIWSNYQKQRAYILKWLSQHEILWSHPIYFCKKTFKLAYPQTMSRQEENIYMYVYNFSGLPYLSTKMTSTLQSAICCAINLTSLNIFLFFLYNYDFFEGWFLFQSQKIH